MVVHLCSMRSNHPELEHNHPTLIVPPGGGAVGEGSVRSNLPELVHNVSQCRVGSALELFKEVRRGSMWSNDPELARMHRGFAL